MSDLPCVRCQSCGKALLEGDQAVLFEGKDEPVVVCTDCASASVPES